MGVGPETQSSRTAVIVAAQAEMFEQLVTKAGYDVVGAAESSINGERLMRHFEPDVVVVDNNLVGPSGWESLPDLRAACPATQVLLVVNEDWTPRDVGSSGAFAVVTRSRLEELVTELDGVDRWIAGAAESRVDNDRRRGRDRRNHTDWNKVGWERRTIVRRAA